MIVVICDDEKLFCDDLEQKCRAYFTKIGELCEIICFNSGEEFLESHIIPDILFQDIELGSMNGIDVVNQLQLRGKNKTFVIYVTSYSHYMRDAFDVNVLGFLEKIVKEEQLAKVIDKVMKRRVDFTIVHETENRTICVRDIQCIRAEGAYSRLYLTDGTEIVERMGLIEWERKLEKYNFYRIHQSWLINLLCVDRYDNIEKKVYIGEKRIRVSFRKQKIFHDEYIDFVMSRF